MQLEVIVEVEGADDTVLFLAEDATLGALRAAVRRHCFAAGAAWRGFGIEVVSGCDACGREPAETPLLELGAVGQVRVRVVPGRKHVAARRLAELREARGGVLELRGAAGARDWAAVQLLLEAEAYTGRELRQVVVAAAKEGDVELLRGVYDVLMAPDAAAGDLSDSSDAGSGGSDAYTPETYAAQALLHAVKAGQTPAVEYLIAQGADPNALPPSFGVQVDRRAYGAVSVLREAAHHGHLGVVRVLLAAGLGRCGGEASGYYATALHDAAAQGHAAVVEALLEAGFAKDKADRVLMTPLHHAAEQGRAEVVRALVRHGARVDERSQQLRTPLHLAAARGFHEIAYALACAGADPRIEDAWGNTAGALAAKAATVNHRRTASVLLAAEAQYATPPSSPGAATASPAASPAAPLTPAEWEDAPMEDAAPPPPAAAPSAASEHWWCTGMACATAAAMLGAWLNSRRT
eukprot:TRINITY_DN18475_c0_g1_i1.p1 TRINITY_DN18475_c0_g1~~TRINITY_DN18475_c0_g1_i1.p1  ORF type:complete len:465 (+),score=154.21 TRINITY_DN18475_c0_g1_i1:83-1477(+)